MYPADMEIIKADVLPKSVEEADFSFGIDSVFLAPFDATPLHVEPRPRRGDGELWRRRSDHHFRSRSTIKV